MRMKIKPLKDGTSEVDVKTLPNGKTLIHWLKEGGPIAIQGHPQLREAMGQPEIGNYHIACNPTQTSINPQKRGNVRYICVSSDNREAVTCPKCLGV